MGIWFPNNVHPSNRVDQLASDIEHLQSQIEQDIEQARNYDERAIAYLDKILKARGFKTLDDLIAEAESKLRKEDRDKYCHMKNIVQHLDDDIKLALNVGSGLMGLGAISGLSAAALGLLCCRQLVMVGFRMIAIGLIRLISGQAETGSEILKAAASIFSEVLKGDALVGKAATAFKVLKVFGKVLAILGILIDAETLIWDVEETKQRDQLQKATKELCVSRLQIKMTQKYARVTMFFSSDAKATLDYTNELQELVDSGVMTQAKVNQKVDDKINKWIPKLKQSIDAVTEKSTYDDLKKFDTNRNSWTNEDPDYDCIIDKLKSIKDSN
ncbi:hypothetical protein AMATHDRAFT_71233 [Amanita thiersii Skay4041]|uniref:Uncharacterized protein n=1 Tax=Amanita thiersii Skay4041 TaxID=703135 RepID=A0A2A9ND89_9AGAR|nr:hypothetical protein AMATHDRAFT_71233 [Amanita thiersii Skay4041]